MKLFIEFSFILRICTWNFYIFGTALILFVVIVTLSLSNMLSVALIINATMRMFYVYRLVRYRED